VDFKAAAREVLRGIRHPLHYSDIIEIALESGYLNSAGRTPQNTMRARLYVDVRDNPGPRLSRPLPASTASKGPLRAPEMLYIERSERPRLQNIEEKRWLR
jgi:HB1, ASXL, restriction endonuclease HTH domain